MQSTSATCVLRCPATLDLWLTLGPLQHGPRDPTTRVTRDQVWRTSRTPEGAATLQVERTAEERLVARAWGPGARWMLEQEAPGLLGLSDPGADELASDPTLASFAHAAQGMRLARTGRVVELLTGVVLEQKVTGIEAKRAFCGLVRHFGERAPGPEETLLLPVSAAQLASLTSMVGTPLGILAKQGATLRRLGERARRLEEVSQMDADAAERRLRAISGIGIWTARYAMLVGLGHPDAVPLGDFWLPHVVAWNLAGEARADDARMLELLEPFAGQRGRVLRWVSSGGRLPPRYGARLSVRPLPRRQP